MDIDKELLKHYREMLHEIKSPLDIIKAHAEYLKKNYAKDPDIIGGYLDIILSETDRLESYLEDLKESIRGFKLDPASTDMGALVIEVAGKLKYELEKKEVLLTVSIANDLPEICVDRNKICQLLINLVKNAADAVDAGGKIEIAAYAGGSFCLSVRDYGRGIEEGRLGRIFEPFYSTKPEGSGLGLHISKKIVEAHGGSLTVKSEAGTGTEFLAMFPLESKEV